MEQLTETNNENIETRNPKNKNCKKTVQSRINERIRNNSLIYYQKFFLWQYFIQTLFDMDGARLEQLNLSYIHKADTRLVI